MGAKEKVPQNKNKVPVSGRDGRTAGTNIEDYKGHKGVRGTDRKVRGKKGLHGVKELCPRDLTTNLRDTGPTPNGW